MCWQLIAAVTRGRQRYVIKRSWTKHSAHVSWIQLEQQSRGVGGSNSYNRFLCASMCNSSHSHGTTLECMPNVVLDTLIYKSNYQVLVVIHSCNLRFNQKHQEHPDWTRHFEYGGWPALGSEQGRGASTKVDKETHQEKWRNHLTLVSVFNCCSQAGF